MLILFNARVFTGEQIRSPVSALAIDRGRIIDSGNDNEILTGFGSHAVMQNMQGRTIWPGLIDAHLHLEHFGLNLQYVNCETPTLADCLERVREKVRHLPPGEWVLGHGWNQNDWPEGFGNVAQLDAVAPDNPVYLTSKSLHSAWTNSKGLAFAQIGNETPDPEGGIIQRDGTGMPTGILFESAVQLCEQSIPTPTPLHTQEALAKAQDTLLRMGVTCVHDFDTSRCFAALQVIHQEGNLNLRVVKGIPLQDLPHALALGLRTGFGDDHLIVGSVKMFEDGALGPRTAAMLEPYSGEINNSGILTLNVEQIMDYAVQAVENGLSLAIHAIGDRANREVLDAYAQIRDYESRRGFPKLRHRIEHVQLLHPDDQSRLAQLHIIASMQPVHATSDMRMAERYWGNRCKDAYAWRTILKNQTTLAFGSDAPVESPNPFLGLHAAVTRCRLDGANIPQGWYPDQKISLHEAVQAYTLGAAYAGGMENRIGKLVPGFFADLIVLKENPFEVPPEALSSIEPEATMSDGKWVWQKE
jgi:predicted amidohydrolase YtcJ